MKKIDLTSISYGLEKIFWLIFCGVLLTVIILSLCWYTEWFQIDLICTFACIIAILLLGAGLLFIIAFIEKNVLDDKGRNKIAQCAVVIFTLLGHVIIVSLLSPRMVQVSDYLSAYTAAVQKSYNELYFRTFPHWLMQCLIERMIMNFAGESYVGIVIANVIVITLAAYIIYLTVLEAVNCWKVALMSALLFSFWPSFLIYTIVFSPEFYNILFILGGILLLCKYVRSISNTEKKEGSNWFYLVGAGFLIALGGLFKPIDKIIIIALVITVVLYLLQNVKQKLTLKRGIISLTIFLLLYGSFGMIQKGIVEGYVGGEVNWNPSMVYMCVGTSVETGGSWDPNIYGKYINDSKWGYKYANDKAKELFIKNINNSGDMLGYTFWKNKIKSSFGNDMYSYIVWDTINDENIIKNTDFPNIFDRFASVFYISMLLVAFIMTCVQLFNKSCSSRFILLNGLIILGMICVVTLGESQARYKCVIYPYISIYVAYGCYYIRSVFINKHKLENEVK